MTRIVPFDFQEADVADLLAHNATGAIVAEVGAGKSVIGAEVARRSGLRTKLIIALPGTHAGPWRGSIIGHYDTDPRSEHYGEWIEGLDPEANVMRIDSTAKGKEAMDALEWGREGYYLMTPQLFTSWKPYHLRPDLTIVDEIHLLGNRNGVGGKAMMKFAKSTGHRIGMSGTFARNRFENLWTAMRFLYPERSAAHDIADIAPNRWIDDNCATKYDHFAPGNRIVVGELNPGEFALRVPCWRQHFKRQECCEFHPEGFLAHLPEPVTIRETIELTANQKKSIRQMKTDYLAYLDMATEEWKKLDPEKRRKKALVTRMPIVRETRIRQMRLAEPSVVPRPWKPKMTKVGQAPKPNPFVQTIVDGKPFNQAASEDGIPLWDVTFEPDAPSPVLDALIRIYESVQEPIVAATTSQKFIAIAVPRLEARGIRAFEWSGEVPQEERDAALKRFEAGEIDIIVGQTAAVGTGIDGLQFASGVLVSLEQSPDMTAEIQLEGRLDRRGQRREDGVIHYQIVVEETGDTDKIDAQLERRFQMNRSLRRDVQRGAA